MANCRHLEDSIDMDRWQHSLSDEMQHLKISSKAKSKSRTPPIDGVVSSDMTSHKVGLYSSAGDNSPEDNIPMYSSNESWSMVQEFLESSSPKLSAPLETISHRRSRSHRDHRPRHPAKAYMLDDTWDIGESRPRLCSMPVRSSYQRPKNITSCDSLGKVSRVRSFVITPKGLVSQGECFLKRSTTPEPKRDRSPTSHTKAINCRRKHSLLRVVILGSSGVGKHSLIHAFIKVRDCDRGSILLDRDDNKSVSILLDGEESTMEFVDYSDRQVHGEIMHESVDAFVVVYSVEDRRSYEASINRLLEVREEVGRHVPLILVANKTDLVRSRVVTEEEGRTAAKTYDSKYIEVSAAIDHKIDDLLVGVLKQIRLFKQRHTVLKHRSSKTILGSCCPLKNKDNVLAKLFRGGQSQSCDNLYVL